SERRACPGSIPAALRSCTVPAARATSRHRSPPERPPWPAPPAKPVASGAGTSLASLPIRVGFSSRRFLLGRVRGLVDDRDSNLVHRIGDAGGDAFLLQRRRR